MSKLTLNGGATSIGTNYYSSTTPLYIYYARDKFDLTFYTNNSGNQTDLIKDIPYEKPLTEYASHSQGQKPGYYFMGWYADPSFTEPFDFNQTMPHNDIAVYGKWKLRRVRVVIEPGANNVYMGSQSSTFRVDYDETIDGGLMESAQRAGYILDGWYTDPEFTNRFLFSNPINDDIEDIDWTYQDDHWKATRIAYGDDDEDNENVRGILHLYAKWIPDTTSTGINVVYDPGDAAVYDSLGNLVTTVPIDPRMYGFDGTATAREAPSNYSDLYEFSHWEATLRDGSTMSIYTGSPIELASLLPQDVVYDENNEELRHTVVLRAVYNLVGDPSRQTTITYDGDTFTETMYNGSEKTLQGKTADGTQRVTITLDKEVNQTIELPSAEDFYLDGYELVGWSFTNGTYAEQVAGATTEAPNFTPGQKVAADNLVISALNNQENTLYAMWLPKKYTVTVKQVVENGVPDNQFTYVYKRGVENNIESATEQTQLLTGNSSFTETDFDYYERVGDVIRIQTPFISENASYDVRVNAIVTLDDGTTEVLNPTSADDYQILGDVMITYTYSPKVLVKLQKRDATNHNTELFGAEFVLTPVELNSSGQWINAGDGKSLTVNIATLEQYLQEGTYKISEINAPSNYANIGTDLYLTIRKDGAFSLFTANGSAVSDSIAELRGEGEDKDRILTVYDNPIRTVTVTKTVAGGGDDSFAFKVTVFNNSGNRVGNYVIGEVNGSNLTTSNIGEATVYLSNGQHVDLKIPDGFRLTVEESQDSRYEASYIWGNEPSVESRVFGNEPVSITANGTLAYTNKPSSKKLRIHKIGDDAPDGLAGATFDLTAMGVDGFSNMTGIISMDEPSENLGYLPGNDSTDPTLFVLPIGSYTLEETAVPQDYLGLDGSVSITVDTEGIVIADKDNVTLSNPDGDGVYTLTVLNTKKTSITAKKVWYASQTDNTAPVVVKLKRDLGQGTEAEDVAIFTLDSSSSSSDNWIRMIQDLPMSVMQDGDKKTYRYYLEELGLHLSGDENSVTVPVSDFANYDLDSPKYYADSNNVLTENGWNGMSDNNMQFTLSQTGTLFVANRPKTQGTQMDVRKKWKGLASSGNYGWEDILTDDSRLSDISITIKVSRTAVYEKNSAQVTKTDELGTITYDGTHVTENTTGLYVRYNEAWHITIPEADDANDGMRQLPKQGLYYDGTGYYNATFVYKLEETGVTRGSIDVTNEWDFGVDVKAGNENTGTQIYLFNYEKYDLTVIKNWLVNDQTITKNIQEIYFTVRRTVDGAEGEVDIGRLIYENPVAYGLTPSDVDQIQLNDDTYYAVKMVPAGDNGAWNPEQSKVISNLCASLNTYSGMENGNQNDNWPEALYTVTELAYKDTEGIKPMTSLCTPAYYNKVRGGDFQPKGGPEPVQLGYDGDTRVKVVNTLAYDVNILKTDEGLRSLANAHFALYSEDSFEEDGVTKKDGALPITEKDDIISGEGGIIALGMLDRGTYYLVETAAPAGYILLTKPVKITVDPMSSAQKTEGEGDSAVTWPMYVDYKLYTVEGGESSLSSSKDGITVETKTLDDITSYSYTLTVTNTSGATLPSTGGPGTTLFYLAGSLLALFAAIMLVIRRMMNSV